ncbi:NAD-dependent protein deacetylase [Planomonospora venezuelensis]|uniref:NAD-dependent protein deacetylase n=2 Tax=Planomonospora venezuelensis TaxID=1999 RepID=A0A841CVM5_PLAVE|nr:NAD-dependent SIR2 family protein deacetylase [Planomonospora venezuelensis]GIN00824.1 NAD-dependent protein deacetylase [Planomonospora venezuelensis]
MTQAVGEGSGGVSGAPPGHPDRVSGVLQGRPDTVSGALPDHPGTGSDPRLRMLADLVADGEVVVLSGAGISTESGIPDYRGESGRRRRAEPMTYQAFTGSAEARRRYWARSHLGWRHIARAAPNAGHHAVTALQERGLVAGVITQNVDGLHQASGTREVVELHGGLDRVRCLGCGERTPRRLLDERLRAANADWQADAGAINPDGDAVLADERVESFRVVDCLGCGGVLKPDVIFFGENVPRARVEECYALTERAGLLLVLGSSLTVMSGYRFVLHAAERSIPIAIVNQGPTRGDAHALLTLGVPLGPALTALLAELDRTP